MKVLFVSDLHGSTRVLEKAVQASNHFAIDVLLVGGDLSGKFLLPVVLGGSGTHIIEEPHTRPGEGSGSMDVVWDASRAIPAAELAQQLVRLEARGFYWHQTDAAGKAALNADPDKLRSLFEDKIYERLTHWSEIVNERLDSDARCMWIGGNDDDQTVIDRLLRDDLGRFEYVENKVVEVDGFEILSYGHTNPTGFNTAREIGDEGPILKQLQTIEKLVRRREHCIFNIHVPPYGCGNLDSVLKDNNKVPEHVGSKDVLSFIKQCAPIADFAGHIHEGKGVAEINRTMVFNPGSEYQTGKMNAWVIDFKETIVKDYIFVDR